MIIYIEKNRQHEHRDALDAYFRLRKRVFCDRLGWVPACRGGVENDAFDALYNIVIVNVDDRTGTVSGGVRLMPTTGPTLLHTVWSDMLPDPDDFRSPNIWEATRFCVDDGSTQSRKRSFVNRATLALSLAVLEFCHANGITHVIGVCEKNIFDMQRAYGTEAEIISTKTDENGTEIGCGLWATGPEARANLAWARAFLGGTVPARLPKVA